MCKIDYTKSLRKISNQNRQGLFRARNGKDPRRCFLHHDKSDNILYVGVPYSMQIDASGVTVDRLHNLYNDVVERITPISMPRMVA